MGVFKRLAFALTFWFAVLSSSMAGIFAQDRWVQFSDTSLTFLVGTNFELTGKRVDTLSLEHVSGWTWGDLFLFLDVTNFHDNPKSGGSWYGEFSPRFSLSKLGGLELGKNGFVKDILVSTTFERGKNGIEALLLGGGR